MTLNFYKLNIIFISLYLYDDKTILFVPSKLHFFSTFFHFFFNKNYNLHYFKTLHTKKKYIFFQKNDEQAVKLGKKPYKNDEI